MWHMIDWSWQRYQASLLAAFCALLDTHSNRTAAMKESVSISTLALV